MHSAEDFFVSTVKPTVNEFLSSPNDLRRGRLAAIVLYHMVDYLALDDYLENDNEIMRQRVNSLREELTAQSSDFCLIKDVADATKHAQLFVSNKTSRLVSSADQITSSPGIFHAPFGEGVFAEASIVFVTLNNGTCKPLQPAVSSIMEIYETRLANGAK